MTLSIQQQAIEGYWRDKPVKAWVVRLAPVRKQSKQRAEFKYVRAKTREGAIRTAKYHSSLTGPIWCTSIRLMGPSDIR
jgi:hypothetical protein